MGLSHGSGNLSKETKWASSEVQVMFLWWRRACEKAEQSFIQGLSFYFHCLSFKAKFDTGQWFSVIFIEKIIKVWKNTWKAHQVRQISSVGERVEILTLRSVKVRGEFWCERQKSGDQKRATQQYWGCLCSKEQWKSAPPHLTHVLFWEAKSLGTSYHDPWAQ